MRFKIKFLKSLNQPKLISLYKVAKSEIVELNSDKMRFNKFSEIKKEEILSVSKIIPGGLNFEPWVKIEFNSLDNKNQIFITSRRAFGFGSMLGDNDRLIKEIKSKYLTNN